MKLPLYGSVQREITTFSQFLPLESGNFPYEEAIFSYEKRSGRPFFPMGAGISLAR